jgi:hypothetical protein
MGYTQMLPLLEALQGSSDGIYESALDGAVREGRFETVQFILDRHWELSPY